MATTIVTHDIAELVELDRRIDFAEGEGLRQRWLFGKELLAKRTGKLLPRGLLEELGIQTGKSRQELQFRMHFAAKFASEEKLSNAVRQFKSWHAIVNNALTDSTRACIQGSGENELYTPAIYIEAARLAMGGIDLDPASHEVAQRTVQATEFFTKESSPDGLERPWYGRVWLNPPYSQPEISLFVEKLTGALEEGAVTQAILLTHNYTDTLWFQSAAPMADAICFTKGRIKFDSLSNSDYSPTQGQCFFYFGPDAEEFRRQFSRFGFIR